MNIDDFEYRLEDIMMELGQPSLKAIADCLGFQASKLYSAAKTPKGGEIYDVRVYNWEAIERFCLRRMPLGQTLETLITMALERDIELRKTDKRKQKRVQKVMIEVEGKTIPERKKVEGFVSLRNDKRLFDIVYKTKSYVCLRPVNEAGEFISEDLKVLSNNTFNIYLVNKNENEN